MTQLCHLASRLKFSGLGFTHQYVGRIGQTKHLRFLLGYNHTMIGYKKFQRNFLIVKLILTHILSAS